MCCVFVLDLMPSCLSHNDSKALRRIKRLDPHPWLVQRNTFPAGVLWSFGLIWGFCKLRDWNTPVSLIHCDVAVVCEAHEFTWDKVHAWEKVLAENVCSALIFATLKPTFSCVKRTRASREFTCYWRPRGKEQSNHETSVWPKWNLGTDADGYIFSSMNGKIKAVKSAFPVPLTLYEEFGRGEYLRTCCSSPLFWFPSICLCLISVRVRKMFQSVIMLSQARMPCCVWR